MIIHHFRAHDRVFVAPGSQPGEVLKPGSDDEPYAVKLDDGTTVTAYRRDLRLDQLAVEFDLLGTRYRVFESPPLGWLDWSRKQVWDYRYQRSKQLRRQMQAEDALIRVAEKEPKPTLKLGELGDAGPVLIRAYFGPLVNVPYATFLVCDLDERLQKRRAPVAFLQGNAPTVHEVVWSGDLGDKQALEFVYGEHGERQAVVHHDPHLWGPKRYVVEMLALIAKYGPGTVVYLVHADRAITVTPEQYRTWKLLYESDDLFSVVDVTRSLTQRSPQKEASWPDPASS